MDFDAVCLACKSGLHEECEAGFAETLAEGEECCCGGEYTLADEYTQMQRSTVEAAAPRAQREPKGVLTLGEGAEAVAEPRKGDSGYIHPDAWLGTVDIGSLTDPMSTGRKRVVRMYPISGGQVCEWAGRKHCGGGPKPVIGCINNPASDQHHGPDKNTLNNEKASRGVGTMENVSIICAECHNAWHAANDPYYPDYDRSAQQAEPWLPYADFEWGPAESEPAEYDELAAEDRRRFQQAQKRGRKNRGRNAQPRTEGDFGFDDATDDERRGDPGPAEG